LELGFLGETEVLNHDVAFDLGNVFFGLLHRILAEVIQELRVVRVDLLLLPFAVFKALALDLVVQRKQHFVTVFLVLDFLLADHLCVFELKQLVACLQEFLHPSSL